MGIRGLDKDERSALVFTEVQQGVLEPDLSILPDLAVQSKARGIAQKMGTLADLCRSLDIPVIHCPLMKRADGTGQFANCLLSSFSRKPSDNMEERQKIHPAVGPKDEDIVIQRYHGLTSFHNTELESILHYHRVQTIILAGVSTNLNLPGTSTEAVNRGFSVVLPEDCTAGTTPEIHEFQMKNIFPLLTTITDSTALSDLLKTRGKQTPPI